MRIVYVNEEVCIGCYLCEVYCQLEHSPSRDLIKTFRNRASLSPPLLQIAVNKPVSFAVQCRHCTEPACVYACITGALGRDLERGVVIVDEEKCIGCWTCILACPFGTIRQDTKRKKILKCDLCQGENVPVCVTNCPNEALICAEVQDGNRNIETQADSSGGRILFD